MNPVPCKPQTYVNTLVTIWSSSPTLRLNLGLTAVILIHFKNSSCYFKHGLNQIFPLGLEELPQTSRTFPVAISAEV